MNSCELVSTITAIACAIAKCVPKEDLPIITSILGQIASTLATIAVNEEALSPPDLPTDTAPGSSIISTQSKPAAN